MDPSARNESPVFFRIEHNKRQIWPQSGWNTVPQFGSPAPYQIEDLEVDEGDAVRFVLKRNHVNVSQPVIWNPVVEIHTRLKRIATGSEGR